MMCRMRHAGGWHDVRVRNISSRGLGAISGNPPRLGECIEVRTGSLLVVARVMWRVGPSFGLRSQDKIDVLTFIEQKSPTVERDDSWPGGERRQVPRPESARSTGVLSRDVGRKVQYATLGIAALGAAFLAFTTVQQTLSAPIQRVVDALGSVGGH